MRLRDMQEHAKELSEKHGWDSESMEVRLEHLSSEVEELHQEIEMILTLTEEEDESYDLIKSRLGYELHDIIWNVADIANRVGIDLEISCKEKIEINNRRIWL